MKYLVVGLVVGLLTVSLIATILDYLTNATNLVGSIVTWNAVGLILVYGIGVAFIGYAAETIFKKQKR